MEVCCSKCALYVNRRTRINMVDTIHTRLQNKYENKWNRSIKQQLSLKDFEIYTAQWKLCCGKHVEQTKNCFQFVGVNTVTLETPDL